MAQTKAGSTQSKTKSSNSRSSTASKSRNGASAQSKRSSSGRARSRDGSDKSKLMAFADRAKAPAAAGGAALLGLAGGVALSRNKRRNGVLGRMQRSVKVPRVKAPQITVPKPDSVLKTIGSAAGEVAERSERVGQVATEVQKASAAITNSKNSKKK
jgi:hypothetical protein